MRRRFRNNVSFSKVYHLMVQNKNGVCTQNSFALLYAEYKRHFLHTLCMNHAEKNT